MGLFGWGKKNDEEDSDQTEEEEQESMPAKLFGKGGMIDFTSPSQEDLNGMAWGRMVELGMATEMAEQCIVENPDDEDYKKLYIEVAVAEAEYESRPWWQKIF